MDLFKLVGSVFVNTDEANKSLQKTDKNASKVGETFKRVAGTAAKVGTAVVAGAATAVTAVVGLANKAAETADTIDKGSIRMGISAEKYQELAYAAGQSGVEMSVLEKAAKSLEGTGLNFNDAINQVMSMGTASERSAKAAELFGESVAYQMSPLIEQSQEDFDGLISRANELGLVMSGDDVKAGVQFGDTLSDIKKSFEALVTRLGSKVMPLVQKFADQIIGWMPTITKLFDKLSPVIGMLFDKLMPPLVDILDEIFPILMDFLEQLLPPITDIVASLLPLIVEILRAFMPVLKPILDLLLAILPAVLDIINYVITPLISLLGDGLKVVMEGLGAVIEWLAGAFTTAWEGIKFAWEHAGEFFSNLWDGITSTFKAALNGIIWFINKMIDGINILLVPLRTVIWAVGELFGASWSMDDVKIPHIPQLAKGGVIDQAGWTITGENGPEAQYMPRGAAVVPLDKALGGAGVEDTLTSILTVLKNFVNNLPSYGVYLDGKALVGKLAPDIDAALGKLADRNRRYA